MPISENIDLQQHFNPLALGLVHRHSAGSFAATFGGKAVAQFPPISLREAAERIVGQGSVNRNAVAALTTDDFKRIIQDVFHAAGVVQTYQHMPEVLKLSHETRDIPDFLPVTRPRVGIFPALEKVLEGSEVQYGDVAEKGESYAATKFSRLVEFTEQALKNDNLGLLIQPAIGAAQATLEMKASVLTNLIEANPPLSDNTAVFHANHGNLAASGTALTVQTLGEAILAMRRQKMIDGERPIDVAPKFLLVPPELELVARQITSQITAATMGDVNPWAGLLEVVVEPRLSNAQAWYLFAEPSRQLSLEHGTVDGTEDPSIRTEERLERHSVVTRVSCDFGAGWIDHRGAFKNPGA